MPYITINIFFMNTPLFIKSPHYINIFLEILVAAVILIFPLMHTPRVIKFYKNRSELNTLRDIHAFKMHRKTCSFPDDFYSCSSSQRLPHRAYLAYHGTPAPGAGINPITPV